MTKKGKWIPGFGYEVPAYAYKADRKIHHRHQIMNESGIVRGKVVRHFTWDRTSGKFEVRDAVILTAPGKFVGFFVFMFSENDKSRQEGFKYELSLYGVSIIQDEDGYHTYSNLGYLVDTDKTMSEEQIVELLKKNKIE